MIKEHCKYVSYDSEGKHCDNTNRTGFFCHYNESDERSCALFRSNKVNKRKEGKIGMMFDVTDIERMTDGELSTLKNMMDDEIHHRRECLKNKLSTEFENAFNTLVGNGFTVYWMGEEILNSNEFSYKESQN